MVPLPPSTARQRYQDLLAQNSDSLFVSDPVEHLKQWQQIHQVRAGGKQPAPVATPDKPSKALSLTASQFRRVDTYDIPSDDGHGEAGRLLAAAERDVDSDGDSLLLDHGSGELQVPTSRAAVLSAAGACKRPSSTAASQSKKGTAKMVRKPKAKPVYPAELPVSAGRVNKLQRKGGKRRRSSDQAKTTVRRPRKAVVRRLPVDELHMVPSALQDVTDVTADPLSSVAGVQTQDPISDLTSSLRRASVSSISSGDGAEIMRKRKAPLSAIRKRLSMHHAKQKSIATLQARRKAHISCRDSKQFAYSVGDGFEASEQRIAYCFKFRKQRRQRQTEVPQFEFSALALESGLLPEVTFDSSLMDIKAETYGEHAHATNDESNVAHDATQDVQPSSTKASKRTVSFSDRVTDDYILARLSSISAPERHRSESDDEEEEEEEEEDDDDEEVGVAEEDEGDKADGWKLCEAHAYATAGARVAADECLISDDERNFKARRSPSPAPQRRLKISSERPNTEAQADPIEDDVSPIDAGPSYHFVQSIPTIGQASKSSELRRRLVEVNEAILDDEMTGHKAVSQKIGLATDRQGRPSRLRSILKNSTPAALDDTTTAEQTATNTRRNSMIDPEESRYFTNAAEQLASTSTAMVVRRRSSYFNEPVVEVEDSDQVVPETSPGPSDFTNANQLKVLRHSSEAMWSSSLPTAPKDLKLLTRTVSREYGTLSQSALRRRPSLPFNSPTKVCVAGE